MYPQLVDFGSISIPTYGILVALGFLAGIALAARLARRVGAEPEKVTNLGVVLLLAAIVGAKLFMVLDNWNHYAADFSRLFSLSALRSGGVFTGGLLAAVAVAYFYTKRHGMPWLATADILAPGLAVGHAIGRLGCFAAGCCWGKECNLAWAVTFRDPVAHEFTGVPLHVPLHPTQLYEGFGTALIGLFLLWRFARPHGAGAILGAYLVAYPAFRILVEIFRADSARPVLVGGVASTTQFVAAGLVIVGFWLLRNARREG